MKVSDVDGLDLDPEPRPQAPGGPAKSTPGGACRELDSLADERVALVSEVEARPSASSMETHHPITLAWHDINVLVRDKKKAKKVPVDVDVEYGKDETVTATTSRERKQERKQILTNVSGVVRPGTLVAIMGASGAGKSTLLNVLTGRNLKDYLVSGDITVNGVAVGDGIRNISAYVQQDDLFMATLTVRETLKFRAYLRMDQRMSMKARMERVEEVIQELGLTKCADTRIGGVHGKRGISGGESKRLSFACEMLTNPPLMFCDEPTSGLDSFMAQNIVQTLQNMASKNHTVLCTIHQPSSEVFAMFDRVLLMAEGRVAFMGSCTQAMEFFRNRGYQCPPNFNPADFFVLTLAIVPGQEVDCRRKVKDICDNFEKTDNAKEITESIKEVSAQASSGSLDQQAVNEAKTKSIKYEAHWGRQFTTVFWRSWISLVRDAFLFRVRVLQTLVVALVIGLIYLRLDYDQKGVMDINGAIFMLVANTTMVNLFSVINSFPVEITLFLREYGSGLYRSDVYYVAKSLAELPTFILLPFVSMTIDYWMIGLYASAEAYLVAVAVAVLIANVSLSFGHVVSTLTGSVNLALAIAPPIVVPFMMFGGFFLNSDSIPVYFIWLKYISWFSYANELLCVNQWEDVDSIDCAYNATAAASQSSQRCLFLDGDSVISYLSFKPENRWLDVGLMFALFGAFRIIAYVCLFIRARLAKS